MKFPNKIAQNRTAISSSSWRGGRVSPPPPHIDSNKSKEKLKNQEDEACHGAGRAALSRIALQWKFVRFTSGSLRNFLTRGQGAGVFALKQSAQTGGKKGAGVVGPIEVSFFIGRELILRRWKCTFTDYAQAGGKGRGQGETRGRGWKRDERWPEARSQLNSFSGISYLWFWRFCNFPRRACVCARARINLNAHRERSPTFLVNGLWGEGMIALAYSREIIVGAEKFFFLFLDRCSRVVDSDFVQSKDLNARRFFLGIKSFNIHTCMYIRVLHKFLSRHARNDFDWLFLYERTDLSISQLFKVHFVGDAVSSTWIWIARNICLLL